MKKLFLLIPLFAFAIMANAKVTNITPTSPYDDHDNLRLALHYAEDGDEIVMAAGTYVESNSNFIAVAGKKVTVRAAAGAEVLIQPQVPITVAEGGKAEFIGVKIDASRLHDLQTWYEHVIYAVDANANNRVILEGCEIYNFSLNKSLIYCAADCALDVLTINNCYFHNIHKSCVFIANTTNPIDVAITNSTFANITTDAGSYSAGVIDVRATLGSFLVDHCTFYDAQAMNTDYAAIGKVAVPSAIVSNSIFMLPTSQNDIRAIRDVAQANNCLTFNYLKDDGKGIHSSVVKSNCIYVDPLFNDLANNKYTYANNWVTMNISPVCFAATDGSDLGDPRWHTVGTLPSVDLSTSYAFVGAKALINGNLWYNSDDAYLYYNDKAVCGTATWKIHATGSCNAKVTLNMNASSTSGHIFKVEIFDAQGNSLGETAEPSQTGASGDIDLPGTLDIPAPGDYIVKLYNLTGYSSAIINSVTFSYSGGATVNIPATLVPTDAMLSSEAWVDHGVVDSILFTARGSEGHNSVNWAKWRVNVPAAGYYNFKANTYRPDGSQKYEIKVLSSNEVTELISNLDESMPSKDASINTGIVYLAEGTYIVKVRNTYDYAKSRLLNVVAEYIGGAVQAMPGTTDINESWFGGATRENGKIVFTSGHVDEGWAKWNVSFADAANYNVFLNINSSNGKKFTVALQDANGDDVVTPLYKNGGEEGTNIALEMGAMQVPAGNYILKVTNAEKWSDAEILGVTFVYAGGAAIDLSKTTPASLLANADAILSSDWAIEEGKIVHAESKALTGWAKWNVDCANDGNYNVTVNISSDNGHLVRVEVFEDENDPAIYTLDEASATKYTTGDLAVDLGNIALDNKEYVFKVSNTVSSSHVQIASIVITYQNGARATLPATCTFADLMLSEKAHVTEGNLWFNTIGDSNPVGQWAKWNVKAISAGTFLFTMNVNSSNSQSYKISILDLDENELDAFESESLGSGDKTIKHYFNLAAGNYIVKLENTYPWSQGHIVSLAVTQPEILVLDEAATDNSVIVANYRIEAQDIQISRTIVPNMYNTICLPFDVEDDELKAIFGNDVELLVMSAATLSGNELTLNFADATSIYRGTPYLIKTSKAVVNPVFTDAIIKEKVGQPTGGDAVDFIGSFIAGEVPAGDQNLFLGPNDLLYFSQEATPIKGMRAYFHVKVPGAANMIQRARIVKGTQVLTSINLVGAESKAVKTIENGQLVITIDGVRYNVMGVKLQ